MELFDSNLKISTKYINLVHVSLDHADEIYDLRKRHKSSVLKVIDNGLDQQKKYLINYFDRFDNREEIYYSIRSADSKKNYGFVRLTQLNNDFKFSYESLVINETAPKNISIDVILTMYKLGFDILQREICGPWVVPANGARVIALHNLMKMVNIVAKNEKYYICTVLKENYKKNVQFFEKLGLGEIFIA